jgi:hypothetical protein
VSEIKLLNFPPKKKTKRNGQASIFGCVTQTYQRQKQNRKKNFKICTSAFDWLRNLRKSMERDDSIPIDLDFIEKNLFGSSIY